MKRLQIKAENVTDQGIFTGHASVFGVVDLDNDVVEPGAFAESIATGTAAAGVLIFGQHDDRKEPLGRSMELRACLSRARSATPPWAATTAS